MSSNVPILSVEKNTGTLDGKALQLHVNTTFFAYLKFSVIRPAIRQQRKPVFIKAKATYTP